MMNMLNQLKFSAKYLNNIIEIAESFKFLQLNKIIKN